MSTDYSNIVVPMKENQPESIPSGCNVSQVDLQLKIMQTSIDRLFNKLEILEERLRPILLDKTKYYDPEDLPPLVPLATDIRTMRLSIDSALEGLAWIYSRIEL